MPETPSIHRAVVTGAAGFIGSHLARNLLASDITVVGVDRRDPETDTTAAANLAAVQGTTGYLHITADLLDCAIDPVFLDADAVFHLAGIPGVRASWGPEFSNYVACNILVTQRVMEAATRQRVPRLVVASSSSVYGPTNGDPSTETDHPRPASPYAVTKLAEEQLCLAHAARPDCPTAVTALRYFTVYGPRQREDMFTHRALTAALAGTPLRLYGDGHQRRDFTYIDDAVNATVAAAMAPACPAILNVAGGSNSSLRDIVDITKSLTGRDIQLHTEKARNGDVPVTRADATQAHRALGWRPAVRLHDGIHAQMQALTQPEALAL